MAGALMTAELDLIDRQLLNSLQGSIELDERPFAPIAHDLGIGEDEVLRRAQALRDAGVLRHLSPIFDVFRIGYKSALIAFAVEPERLEEAAAVITAHPGVSHNYAREHRFNIWFVLAIPREHDFAGTVAILAEQARASTYHVLPAIKLFKIAVEYDMVGKRTDAKPREPRPTAPRRELTAHDQAIIRVCQDDLPLVSRPWAIAAERLGLRESALLEDLRAMRQDGILRRFAAVLRHQEAGFSANGMACWRAPDDRIEEVGLALAADTRVSHCYWRPTFPDWPYPLFSMVHCETRDDVVSVVKDLARTVNIDDYEILWSAREFKKERVRYFIDQPAAAAPASTRTGR
ncbi:MAG: Lrp/AsnC family transcriptional regulator [Chloroflexota bacterium]|nr:Lrp/AsnC family transcriptional regulator [Chloroflexota bacterium]